MEQSSPSLQWLFALLLLASSIPNQALIAILVGRWLVIGSSQSNQFITNSPMTLTLIRDFIFPLAWQWQYPQSNCFLLWKVYHGKLLTNEERNHCYIAYDSICMCCNYHDDFIMCVIHDYQGVDEHLDRFISHDMRGKFFTLGLSHWLIWNLISYNIDNSDPHWSTYFAVTTWRLGRDHTLLIFL